MKAAILAVVLFLLPAPGRAYAQSAGASPVAVQWDNGLTVAADGGASELRQDEFVMRRVRLIAQGRIAKYFEFRLMPDFGNGATVLYDAYIDVRLPPAFPVRIG